MKKRDKYFDFTGSYALIVGGATGLGKEISRALLQNGCEIIIASRNQENLNSTKKELTESYGGTVHTISFDIMNENSVKEMIHETSEIVSGKLNIVVNSSGCNIRNPIQDITLEEWNKIISTNLTGAFLLAKYSYSLLKNSDFGRLINITSIFSTVSFPDRNSYSSSKGGMLQLTKTLALEWADKNITVNSISPGPFLTEMNKKVLDNPKNYQKFCERIPMKRFGNPEEIITSALFLASKHTSYVTGTNLIIDGGWTSA